MAGSERIFPAVAMADAFTATMAFNETKKLPELETHPLRKLFPEFVSNSRDVRQEACLRLRETGRERSI